MEFQSPYAFIVGVMAFGLWALGYFKLTKKAQITLPKRFLIKRNLTAKLAIFIIGTISWILLTISLMGPRESVGFDSNTVEIADVYIVFDVSRSMLAEDFPPNRLEAAKVIMSDYVDLKPQARIGVVMFSEQVFTLIPLTLDFELVKRAIASIDIGFLGSGTNIGDALGLAVGRLSQSQAESKVVILLTDGVNNVGSMTPLQAAEIARDRNVKIYAIGMGGDGDARIPLPGSYLGRRQYQTIPGGSIDEANLKQISEMTGGRHWMATESDSLRAVFREIERLERSEVEASSRILYKENYFFYLLYGFILLLLAEVLKRLWLREVT